MTLLHTRFESGLQLTAGTIGAGSLIGPSGLNDMNARSNFANYDFPNNGSMSFTYTNGQITQMVVSGTDQSYVTDIRYKDGVGIIGSVVTSGTTIGSTIITEMFSSAGQFVSGTVSLS